MLEITLATISAERQTSSWLLPLLFQDAFCSESILTMAKFFPETQFLELSSEVRTPSTSTARSNFKRGRAVKLPLQRLFPPVDFETFEKMCCLLLLYLFQVLQGAIHVS